jgi:hypothetical protein
MNWRSRGLITLAIFILVIIVAGTGLFFWQRGSFSQQQSSTAITPKAFPTTAPNGIPIPGPGRTTYTNTKNGYSFTYPSEWRLSQYTDQGKDVVQGHYPAYVGDRYPFQVTCQANPNGLDAQTWFNQHNLYDTGLGYTALGNGLTAYLSVGHGEVEWKSYTLVHSEVACEVTTFIFINDDAINQVNNSIVNNFTWVSS